ncbi:MAG: PRC-barrel domain-containing protein [Actinomycetota bacterium]
MSASGRPIAWSALEKGTPVFASDGTELGKVTEVVADEQKDIFSGVAFRSGLLDSESFAPAERIEAITDEGVRLALGVEESASLGTYER